MKWAGAVATIACCLPVPVVPSAAQEANLLLGGVHARYADSLAGTAGMVGIDLGLVGSRVSARGSMALSQFATGEWAWQGSGRAILAHPLRRTLAVGLLASGSLNDFEGGRVSGEWLTSGVVNYSQSGWSLIGQLGGGLVRQIDANTLWVGTALATAGREIAPGVTAGGSVRLVGASDVAYGDAGIEGNYERAHLTMSGGMGIRVGDLSDDPFGWVRVGYAATEAIELEASAGRYAADLIGFQEGVYGTVGVRVALTNSAERTGPDEAPVVVEPVDDSLVAVTVRYTGPAQQVNIVGEWNGWQTVPMHAIGAERWRAVLPIPAGIHEFSLVVDGEDWTVPDGAVQVPDGFGGQVAVLVVPES